MQEQRYPGQPWGYVQPVPTPPSAPRPNFPAGKREGIFAAFSVFDGLLICNFILFGGFNLGFALTAIISICCVVGYLHAGGCRMDGYSGSLLGLSILAVAGFARSDDLLVKLCLLIFLMFSVNLGLCLMAGQDRYHPAGICSVIDAPRTAFMLGIGEVFPAIGGLFAMLRKGGPAVRKCLAVLIGLGIALPVLCIMIPLLISADAAFDGLIRLLPDLDIAQLFVTIIFGTGLACILFTRGSALLHRPKELKTQKSTFSVSSWTVNTVLIAVMVLYAVYLLSQLAYLIGGFSGILPESFTMAEYARRGFFEMAVLCAVDLAVIGVGIGLVRKKEEKAPILTRMLCLFVGLVTLFFVVTASAKMFLYIGSYGLTRLRVLTEVFMIFLGLATTIVCTWLFLPKLHYFKVISLLALVISTAVIWVDIDTVVAGYNVSAYQQGRLDTIDMDHLESLGDGAIPQIVLLTDDTDPVVAQRACEILRSHEPRWSGLRDWNLSAWLADHASEEYGLE